MLHERIILTSKLTLLYKMVAWMRSDSNLRRQLLATGVSIREIEKSSYAPCEETKLISNMPFGETFWPKLTMSRAIEDR